MKPKLYKDSELVYTATQRCRCGRGMAHPIGEGSRGFWKCSYLLTVDPDPSAHHMVCPFVFWEFKSEDQPSAKKLGQTTRPK